MVEQDLQTFRTEKEAKIALVLERRNITFSKLREVLASYQRKISTYPPIPKPLELAYWSAYSALVVNRCFEAVERDAPFSERCELRDQAIHSHKLRALVYWVSMNEVYQYAHTRAPKREDVGSEDRERTYTMTRVAEAQIQGLSSDFEIVNLGLKPQKEPLKTLGELVDGYNSNAVSIPTRDCLAYWNAMDALTVHNCFLALSNNADMAEMVRLDDLAYDSHHRRAVAYWEAIHRFDSDNYGDLIKKGSGDGLKKLLWEKFEHSHGKISALEDELSLLSSGIRVPAKPNPKNFEED